MVEIGPVVLEKIFLNVVNVFSLFCYYPTFGKVYNNDDDNNNNNNNNNNDDD